MTNQCQASTSRQAMRSSGLTRRTLFTRAVFALAGTALGSTLLSACAPTAPSAPSRAAGSAASQKLQLPTRTPLQGPAADLPGTDIIPNGYTAYPRTLFKAVPNLPGKGGDVTLVTTFSNPVAPYESNTLWQGVGKAMGVNLKLNLVPFADYSFGKFQTIVAGDDLPDLLFVPIGGVIPELPSFLETKCADLTPYLSGDAVKDYPNLANLPTLAWKNVVFNGKLLGVPVAQSVFYWALWMHQELLDDMGAAPPTSTDDFKRLLVALTKPNAGQYGIGFEVGNRYAFSLTTTGGTFFPALFAAPNNWLQTGGKFTKDFETEQYKAAVGYARDLFAAGVFDPNTTYTTPTARQAFQGRKIAFRFDGLATAIWDGLPNQTLAPPNKSRLALPIPAQAGGKSSYNFGPGYFGTTVLKKASSDRIKELLGILNFIASPIGSEEHLLLNYGIEGNDHITDANGNPILTPQGMGSLIPWTSVINPAPALYNAKAQDFAPVIQASEKLLGAVGIYDDSIGLYSATNQRQGVAVQQRFADGMIDIVAGRRPLSDFDPLLKDWKSGGGDTIRTELEVAFAAAA
jgi:putative aldouronate transport system substrate-binding protein